MDDIAIPFCFLEGNNIVLSAKEVDYAVRYDLIYLKDLGKIVDASLVKYPNDKYLLELALKLLLDNSYINTDVSKDIKGENDFTNNKWRYILLLWSYKNREGSTADYDRINIIYADFGYPLDMEKFISYMPAHDDYEKLDYQNILNSWHVYLNTYRYLIDS